MLEEDGGIIDNIRDRIVTIMNEMGNYDPGSKEYSVLSKELQTLANMYKAEADYEKNDLEWNKFTFEKGKDIVETERQKTNDWWDHILRAAQIVASISVPVWLFGLGMKYEIASNVIGGKVSWEAMKEAFRMKI